MHTVRPPLSLERDVESGGIMFLIPANFSDTW